MVVHFSNLTKPLFYLSVLIILTLNFKGNILGSAWDFYHYFQYDSESLVVGRLSLSMRDGLLAHAGFLGWVYPAPEHADLYWYQYDAFRYGYNFDAYQAYYSQPAMQAFLYGMFCKITGLSGNTALEVLWWLMSIFSAMMFTGFIAWVLCRWGWFTAIFTLLGIALSQWITVFGYNLYWILGAFYLPFVVSLWYLQILEPLMKRPLRATFWVMFAVLLLKCLLNGFEFITTTLVMAVTPWVFYAVADRWSCQRFLKHFAVASAGAISAVLLTIGWLTIQLSFVKGSLSAGFGYILFSFGKRTHSFNDSDNTILQFSLDSNLWDVLITYWNGHAFNLAHWSDNTLWQSVSRVSFGFCVLLFLVFSFVVLWSKTIRRYPTFRRQQLALTAMLWVSLLAPLSWFVIFKGHSYIHTHMNHIVWHMPYILLGAILVGSTRWFFIRRLVFPGNNIESPVEIPDKKSTKKRILILYCSISLTILILLRLFVFEPFRVSGSSMEQTIRTGDWVIVNKLRYGGLFPRTISDIPIVNVLTWIPGVRHRDTQRQWHYRRISGYAEIERNDVVVCMPPGQRQQIIKRVIGLPGDTVEIRSGHVWINGDLMEDIPTILPGLRADTVNTNPAWTLSDFGPIVISDSLGQKNYFLMGDHRDESFDSRYFGLISEELIIGKASFILFAGKSVPGTAKRRRFFHFIR